ncbi:TRAP transporter large permease [Pararhodobacter sp.]|uniref:TRAP transporter large permease n=1 Tax=Pararhodobacter sp. TaxID=2127056 RepID=UPI002FDDE8A7
MTVFVAVTLLFVLLLLGIPVAFVLLSVGIVGLYMVGGTTLAMGILNTAPLSAVSSYELITIPMFILMANFIVIAGIAEDLFKSATIWMGRVRGGLAIGTALVGAIFGAVCGSSAAAAATLSSVTLPAMDKRGYEKSFSSGVVAISGTLAMLIPPSILVLIYAIIAEASIGKLLVATILPSLVVALTIVLTVMFLVWRDPSLAPKGEATTWKAKLVSLKIAGPMVGLIVTVMGLIYLGVATPTEASGLGAAGALLVALMFGRMTWVTFWSALVRTASTSVMILAIILGAKIFGYFITVTQMTQLLIGFVGGLNVQPWVILAIVILVYLILGAFMDSLAIIILTVPIILPMMVSLGYDPIFFGVIMIIVVEIGLVTPPFGIISFIVAKTANRPIGTVFRGVWPHVATHLIAILILCLFPQIILWLPSHM